jgi:hypothetical protein
MVQGHFELARSGLADVLFSWLAEVDASALDSRSF